MQAVNQAGSATWDPGGGRQGPKADGGRKGGPQTAGDPDLPQTLGPSACAPYPSPMLSEEGELLLDSPALEVSDSESDEVLGAGPEGRGSEAGTWEQVGRAARRGAEAGRRRGGAGSPTRDGRGAEEPGFSSTYSALQRQGHFGHGPRQLWDRGRRPPPTSLCLGFPCAQQG